MELKTIVDYYHLDVFNGDQLYQIDLGLKEGIDVDVYAKPEYKFEQMYEIRMGLKEGLDISLCYTINNKY